MSRYVVIDLEMCNVPGTMRKQYGWRQEIIQIGAVLLDEDLNVVSKFNRYVRPQYGYLDGFIKGLTGIGWNDLANAPLLAEALMDFNPYYRSAFLAEKDEPLGYSMGDLFAGLNLSGLAVA